MTVQKKTKLGILGVAKINNRVIPSFARTQFTELSAIASRSQQKANAAAKEANIPKAYGSYEALLKDPEIDIIYNPLPNHLHAEWTKKAADHGKHVICEKPLAPTAKEAEELVNYCAKKGVKLMDGFMWPHHPRTAKIKAMLKQGQIGDPLRVHGVFTFFMEDLECSNVRLYPEMGGGGLLDVGCYPIFGIRWAMESEPISVYAQAQYHRGVDVAMTGILNFADGRVASFDCGFTLPVRMGFEIVGSDGVLNIPNFWLPEQHAGFSIQRNGNLEHHHVPGFDQIALMHDHFSQAILNKTAVIPEAMEAVKTLRVLDALAKSARESRVIHL